MTQLIATLGEGLNIPSGNLQPGLCKNVSITASNLLV